jgi:rod shape-determining protein MreD
MIKGSVFFILFFYTLSLVQTSFMVHFDIPAFLSNLILILVILINLFQKTDNYSGVIAAIFAGLFLDIFSSWPIGFWTLLLFLISIFIKKILKDYVRIPSAIRT